MISNSPEYLIEEVMNQYGIEVPMETVLTYLDSDPYLTPESLYDYVTRYGEEEKSSPPLLFRYASCNESNNPLYFDLGLKSFIKFYLE